MSPKRRLQLLTFTVLAGTAVLAYAAVPGIRAGISHASRLLAGADVTPVRDYILSFGLWGPVIAVSLHLLAAVVAPLPSFVVTFATAMVYGWVWGTVISWSAALFSSAVCFTIARVYGRPLVEKVVPDSALDWFDTFFCSHGSHSVLIARLIPVVSFDFVSYGAGLTSMGIGTFLLYTGIGMAPATVVYSYLAGKGASSVIWLFYAFVAVGVLAVLSAALRPWLERWRTSSIFWRLVTRWRAVRGEGEVPFATLRQPLSSARIALITTAGVHHRDQAPFDCEAGDWSYRAIAGEVEMSDLVITHTHYDTSDAAQDPACVFPLPQLRELAAEGIVGGVSPVHFGLMGYIPEPHELVTKSAPEMAKALLRAGVDAVVISPG